MAEISVSFLARDKKSIFTVRPGEMVFVGGGKFLSPPSPFLLFILKEAEEGEESLLQRGQKWICKMKGTAEKNSQALARRGFYEYEIKNFSFTASPSLLHKLRVISLKLQDVGKV